jgi:surface-anchored protein
VPAVTLSSSTLAVGAFDPVDGRAIDPEYTTLTKVYREPSGTILWLKPSSLVTIPAGYGQVGAVGSQVWQVPQTQNLDLIWLGWNTEALNAGNISGPVTWTINQVAGPGSMKVYLSSAFGGVQQMVFNNGGSYQIPQGVHAHANWAFSAEGIYRVTMTQTVALGGGESSSDTETLVIVVGDVDPATAAGNGSGCGTISNALLLAEDADKAPEEADQAAADAAEAARGALPGQQSSQADSDAAEAPAAQAQEDPATARLLTDRLGIMMLLAPAIGGLSALAGLYISWSWDLPTGGVIVLVLTAVFLAAWLLSPRQGVLARLAAKHRARPGLAGTGR